MSKRLTYRKTWPAEKEKLEFLEIPECPNEGKFQEFIDLLCKVATGELRLQALTKKEHKKAHK